MISRSRHTDNLWKLDWHDTLLARAFKAAHREPPKRLVRGVALALVGSLCLATPTSEAQTLHKEPPMLFATRMIGELQAQCLFRIAIKESNINYKALNKSSGAYGAWQFLASHAKRLDPYEQVLLAIDYSNYRYGSPCKAWSFWQRNYWW